MNPAPRRPRALLLCLKVLAACALLGTAAAQPADITATAGSSTGNPFTPPAEQVPAIYDYETISNVTDRLKEFLELNDDLPGSVTPAPLTTVAARQNLRARLQGDGNRAFLAAVNAAPKLKTVESLHSAALTFVAKGRNAEAFVCLVLATERAPQDPTALLNLAAIALAFRQANEALPLIAEAEKSGPLPPGAWGLPGPRLADYLRGYAHLLRGEYPQARALLSRVVAAEPNLREAALALALVESKLGANPRKPFLQGVWRRPVKLIVNDVPTPTSVEEARREPDAFTEGENLSPSMSDLFDLSGGQPGKLSVIKQPTTPSELLAVLSPYTEGMLESMTQAARFSNEVAGPASAAFDRATAPAAYKRRMTALYNRAIIRHGTTMAVTLAARETDFLAEQYDRLVDKAVDFAMAEQEPIRARHARLNNQPGHPTYEEMRQQAAELNATTQKAMNGVEPPLRQYLQALSREYLLRSSYMLGMLKYIGAPPLRAALQAEAESVRFATEQAQFAAILRLAHTIGAMEEYPPRKPEIGIKGNGPPCSDDQAAWSVNADLGLLGVEISCTSVSLEVEAPLVPPFAGLSGEIGLDTSGAVTLFAGPKASLQNVGSAKTGVYLVAGKEGMRDWGAKMEVKSSTGFGPMSVNRKLSESSVSFLPGPDPGNPPGPLPAFRN